MQGMLDNRRRFLSLMRESIFTIEGFFPQLPSSLHHGKTTTQSHQLGIQGMPPEAKSVVVIRYTNYRGETADRRIIPIRIRFGSTEWHPEEQWLLDAFDLDRGADRAFALKDVLQWRSEANSSAHIEYRTAAS